MTANTAALPSRSSFTLPLSRTNLFGLLLVLGALYYSSLHSFLLFHSLVELFSVLVSFAIFVIAWNARHIIKNHYLLFLGIAYLFDGVIDL
ncbi:MAG: MASE3 domain-containing protein, partial [Deltaproteobacteria bacterium]